MNPGRSIRERLGTDQNPYPGLRPFEHDEAHLFFGRDEQIAELVVRLGKNRLVAVVGVSGSGKSSLVRAGLIPALRRGAVAVSGGSWRIVVAKPGDAPFARLAAEISDAQLNPSPLRRSSLGLVEIARQLPSNQSLLVIIDQFEELFRYKDRESAREDDENSRARAAAEASDFVQMLQASTREQPPVFVVLTMRTEYLGDCAEFRNFPETLNECSYLVPRLTREQRKLAIEGPLGARAEMEPSLVQRLLNDAGEEPDQLPVLQHALMRTWSRSRPISENSRRITLDDYETIGGIDRALNQHADELLESEISRANPLVPMWIFQRLTARGPTQRERRDPATLEELWAICDATTGRDRQIVTSVVDLFRLGDATFLSPRTPSLLPDQFVDITHESLIRKWTRLAVEWLPEEQKAARTLIDLRGRATVWKEGGGELLHGLDLSGALRWKADRNQTSAWAEHYVEMSGLTLVLEYIDVSVDADKKRVSKERTSFWTSIYALSVSVAVLILVAIIFFNQKQTAQQGQQTAIAGEQLARAKQLVAYSALSGADPTQTQTSLLLAIEAVRIAPLPEALDRIRELVRVLPIPVARFDYGRPVRAVAVSRDGGYVAMAPDANDVHLWDARNRKDITLSHDARVTAVAFSPDGTRLVTTTAAGQIKVWATTNGQLQTALPREATAGAAINGVAFHPDGRHVATAGDDRLVRLWDLDSGSAIATGRHSASVYVVAFDSIGDRLASAGDDGGVRLWSVASASTLRDLGALKAFRYVGSVSSLSFVDAAMVPGSKPGTVWLLSSNHARTLTLANVTEGVGRTFDATQLAILPASVGRFSTPIVLALPPRDAEVRKSSLIVSPSGFVEALSSGFARLWTPSTGRDQTKDDRAWVEEARIIQESTVIAASVSAIEGGYLVATGDAGGSGRVWRIDKATDVEPSEDPAKVIAWACRHVTHELTVEEKFKYLPEASRSTCGSAPPVAGSQQPPATR